MDLPSAPQALRIGRVRGFDARTVVGVVLVMASVAAGISVVSHAARTQPLLVATRPLAQGTVLSAADLGVIDVKVGAASANYLPSSSPVIGQQLVRPVGAGELVPRAAVASSSAPTGVDVTLPVAVGHFPPDLQPGDLVDVYVSGHGPNGSSAPTQALSGVRVASLAAPGTGVGDGNDAQLVLLVPAGMTALAVGAAEASAVDIVRLPIGASAS
jgi:Flp pilus assembly protein CpaB